METANYNPILEILHKMHRQFAVLIDEVNGGILRIRGLEDRIAQLNRNLEAALKVVLNQRIAMDQKQAQLEENEKNIERRRSQLDEAKMTGSSRVSKTRSPPRKLRMPYFPTRSLRGWIIWIL